MKMDVKSVVEEFLNAMGADYQEVSELEIAGQTVYMIRANDGKALIGAHGDTIHALDLLVKKVVERAYASPGTEQEEMPHFLVDVNDYRTAQIRDLQTKAKMMAERARSFQYDVELSPMSAYERLIVHTTLQDEPNVKTESFGEGRGRRVVIRYTA